MSKKNCLKKIARPCMIPKQASNWAKNQATITENLLETLNLVEDCLFGDFMAWFIYLNT